MVDALKRAHRMVRPDGCLLDLHPTAVAASMQVGAVTTGLIDAGDAPLRHAAAAAALEAVVDLGLFTVDRACELTFYTYGDTVEELRDYIVENWRSARVSAGTIDRTRQALRGAPGARPRVLEHVRATRLRPADPARSGDSVFHNRGARL